MAGYSKEFLVDAFMSRYEGLEDVDTKLRLSEMAWNFYDEVGKDTFRTYCSLDAEAIRKFKLESAK